MATAKQKSAARRNLAKAKAKLPKKYRGRRAGRRR